MFRRKTLFVVGAGASREVNFPDSRTLADIVGAMLSSVSATVAGVTDAEFLLHQLFKAYPSSNAKHRQAAQRIRAGIGLANSIDDFLDTYSNDEAFQRVGKIALVRAILESESGSKLWYDQNQTGARFNLDKVTDTWFVKFFRMLVRNASAPDYKDVFKNVSFIVFNYDRCLEFFLLHALQLFFGLSHNDAAAIVTKLEITHPYGMVAPLLFVGPNGNRGIPFGGQQDYDYVPLVENIKTYTEQTKDPKLLDRMHAQVREAECIVFLGFGFHRPNMELLRPTQRCEDPQFVYATADGMSDPRVNQISVTLQHTCNPAGDLRVENSLKCAQLFDHFGPLLTGGD
jgi:hypothetical protein